MNEIELTEHTESDLAQANALNRSEYFQRVLKKHYDLYTNQLRGDVSEEALLRANIAYRAIHSLWVDLMAPIAERERKQRDIERDSQRDISKTRKR